MGSALTCTTTTAASCYGTADTRCRQNIDLRSSYSYWEYAPCIRIFVTNYDESHISDLPNLRRAVDINILPRIRSIVSCSSCGGLFGRRRVHRAGKALGMQRPHLFEHGHLTLNLRNRGRAPRSGERARVQICAGEQPSSATRSSIFVEPPYGAQYSSA